MEELNTTTLEAVMEAVIQKHIPMDFGPWKSFSKEVRASGPPCNAPLRCCPLDRISQLPQIVCHWCAFQHGGLPASVSQALPSLLKLD